MSLQAIRSGILLAKRHQGGLKMLPCLSVEKNWLVAMQAEAQWLSSEQPSSEMNRGDAGWIDIAGYVTQHSLFNSAGTTGDPKRDFSRDGAGTFFLERECPAIERFFVSIAERIINFRMNGIAGGAMIGAHEEAILKDDALCLRFHLPLVTNPGVKLVLDQEAFRFEAGVVYFFNKGCIHSAINTGSTPRFHLVWDMWLDEWIYERMLNRDNPKTPAAGLRKLTSAEGETLSRGNPYTIDEYVSGALDGTVIRTRKVTNEAGEVRVERKYERGGPDIVDFDSDISLGMNWHALEQFGGDTFRWIESGAEIIVQAEGDGSIPLSMSMEPGPGAANGSITVQVTDRLGCEVSSQFLSQRQTVRFDLPVHRGLNQFRLNALGGGRRIGSDPRVLNVRVFEMVNAACPPAG